MYILPDWLDGRCEAKQENFTESEWTRIKLKKESLYKNEVDKKFMKYSEVFNEKLSKSSAKEKLLNHQLTHLDILFDVDQDYFEVDLNFYLNGIEIPDDFKNRSLEIARRRAEGDRSFLDEILYPDIKACLKQSDNLKLNIEHDALLLLKNEIELLLYKSKPKRDLKNILTHKQQILSLYYLKQTEVFSFNKIHQDQTKQAKLLHAIINRDESNTRVYINKVLRSDTINEIRTKNNLNVILPYFEAVGLNKICKLIKNDLKELNSD